VSRDGGVPIEIAQQASQALRLALDSAFVYWTSGPLTGDPTGSVSRAPLDGSAPPLVLASGLTLAFEIAVDGRYLYWVDLRGLLRVDK
jgi:hypothetical protein